MQLIYERADFSVESDYATVSMNGEMTYTYSTTTSTTTFATDLSGTSDGNTMDLNGTIAIDSNNVVNGSYSVEYMSKTYTCTFDDFDVDTATSADWDAICS